MLQMFIHASLELSAQLKSCRVVMSMAFMQWHKVPAWCAASALCSSAEAASSGTQHLARKLDCTCGKSQLFHTTLSWTTFTVSWQVFSLLIFWRSQSSTCSYFVLKFFHVQDNVAFLSITQQLATALADLQWDEAGVKRSWLMDVEYHRMRLMHPHCNLCLQLHFLQWLSDLLKEGSIISVQHWQIALICKKKVVT